MVIRSPQTRDAPEGHRAPQGMRQDAEGNRQVHQPQVHAPMEELGRHVMALYR